MRKSATKNTNSTKEVYFKTKQYTHSSESVVLLVSSWTLCLKRVCSQHTRLGQRGSGRSARCWRRPRLGEREEHVRGGQSAARVWCRRQFRSRTERAPHRPTSPPPVPEDRADTRACISIRWGIAARRIASSHSQVLPPTPTHPPPSSGARANLFCQPNVFKLFTNINFFQQKNQYTYHEILKT